jgi:hypothetical protein
MEPNETPMCPHCKVELRGLGELRVVVGAPLGGWIPVLNNIPDMNFKTKPLDLYRCEKCGRLEFYDHDFSLPER